MDESQLVLVTVLLVVVVLLLLLLLPAAPATVGAAELFAQGRARISGEACEGGHHFATDC